MAAVIPGYHGNLLEVDLSTARITVRKSDKATLQQYNWGTGLGARILFDELGARIDLLSADGVLLLLSGPFAGTCVPCADRTRVVCKSPLQESGLSRMWAAGSQVT